MTEPPSAHSLDDVDNLEARSIPVAAIRLRSAPRGEGARENIRLTSAVPRRIFGIFQMGLARSEA
jgi:hypothetical protein